MNYLPRLPFLVLISCCLYLTFLFPSGGQKQDAGMEQFEIVSQSSDHTFTSQNPTAQISTELSPQGFLMSPKGQNEQEWEVAFNLLGVARGDQLVYPVEDKPRSKLSVNLLQLDYSAPFSAQYHNGKQGLRQNFLVYESPEGSGALKIWIDLKTGLQSALTSTRDLLFLDPNQNQPLAWYRDLKVWDAKGKELPAHMELEKMGENTRLALVVMDDMAQYPITIDPLATGVPDAQIDGNQSNGQFGVAVSTAGDLNGDGFSDVAIGANAFDNGTPDEGAVFIYYGSESGISTTPGDTLDSGRNGCNFGFAVSTAGDVNGDGFSDLLVGAATWSNPEFNEGAIFLYYGSATGINPIPAAKIEANQAQTNFGLEVSCLGDLNNDGFSEIGVGAPGFENGQTDEGAAYIYFGSATGLQVSTPVVIESNQAQAAFGQSVVGLGDLNGDGFGDMAIGANQYDDGQVDEGAVFIYYGNASGIQLPASDTITVNQAGAWLGYSISNVGDVNGDGYADLLTGATLYTNGESQEGVIYLYPGNSSGVDKTPLMIYESNIAGLRLGETLSAAGDVNGDGYNDFAVGLRKFTQPEFQEGGCYLFYGGPSGPTTAPNLILDSDQAGAEMGLSVSPAGDVNGDGLSDLVVGAFLFDNGQVNEGIAWIYHGNTSAIVNTPVSQLEGGQANAELGFSVSAAGDVNGDGYPDAIVGARNYDNGNTNEGAVFVYHGGPAGIPGSPNQVLEIDQDNALFGTSVACAGDVNGDGYADVLIGAPLYDNGTVDEGAAFLFYGSASGLQTLAAAVFDNDQANSQMGSSVAGIGDVDGDGFTDIAVGSRTYDNGETDEGAVFVYHGGSGGVNLTPARQLEPNQAGALFGTSVANAGDLNGDGYSDLAVGGIGFDAGNINEGAVWIYPGSMVGITVSSQVLEGNQDLATFGVSVSTAGDVNADGYGDLVIGAYLYDNGQTNEGIAQVFHGSAGGILTTPQQTLSGGQMNAFFGYSVSSAGDINGDGYSDVVVGGYGYDNGNIDEGIARLFLGSPSGTNPIPVAVLEGGQDNANLGWAVGTAGDLDGDGYSDLLLGMKGLDNLFPGEGGIRVFEGNQGNNLGALTRQYRADLITPLAANNFHWGAANQFGIGHFSKSNSGREKGRLVWEVVDNGAPFSGIPITNGVARTGQGASWTDLGTAGTELKEQVDLTAGIRVRWRTRVQYHPATMINGQPYSRWFYGTQVGNGDFGVLPREELSFAAELQADQSVDLDWQAPPRSGIVEYQLERSVPGEPFVRISTHPDDGNSINFNTKDPNPASGTNQYRLKCITHDGQVQYSQIEIVVIQALEEVQAYPNPTHSNLNLVLPQSESLTQIRLVSLSGEVVANWEMAPGTHSTALDLGQNPAGIYLLKIQQGGENFVKKLVIR